MLRYLAYSSSNSVCTHTGRTCKAWLHHADWYCVEDGKEMKIDLEKLKIRDIQEEVDRHSRILKRDEELKGN